MDGLRTLMPGDIARAKELSDAEGWNQTIRDWELLVTAPGNICLALTENDKTIATATAMNYEKELAWIGMVLVEREYRGKGLSKRLLITLLNKLKSFRSVRLDATPAGQPVYQKLGFTNECLIYRMTAGAVNPEALSAYKDGAAEPTDDANIEEICQYDRQVTGINRKVLLEYLADGCQDSSLVIKKQKKVSGFIMGRAGSRFHQLGPLVADSAEIAKHLLVEALMNQANRPVVVDVPEGRDDLIRWLKSAGFIVQRHFMRMYLENDPFYGMPENYFLIAGPEFG